jgi:hypothetical protein
VVALDVPYNVEVIDNAGLVFSREREASPRLQDLTDNFGRIGGASAEGVERIRSHYSWEKIIMPTKNVHGAEMIDMRFSLAILAVNSGWIK